MCVALHPDTFLTVSFEAQTIFILVKFSSSNYIYFLFVIKDTKFILLLFSMNFIILVVTFRTLIHLS